MVFHQTFRYVLASIVILGATLVNAQEIDFHITKSKLAHKYDSIIASGDTTILNEGGVWSQFNRWSTFWSYRIPDGLTFEDCAIANEQVHGSMPVRMAHPKSSTTPWHEIGPLDKPTSGEHGGSQVIQPTIGPVRFIEICPSNPNLVVCGNYVTIGNGGGLFYRDIANMTEWAPAGSDAWPASDCVSAAFNSDNSDVWYAANHGYLGAEGGIHRKNATDFTWTIIANHINLQGYWNTINKIVTFPGSPDKLIAATNKGLFVSNDINVSQPQIPQWTKVQVPAPTSDPVYGSYSFGTNHRIYDIEVNPNNPLHVYISVEHRGESTDVNGNAIFVNYWRVMQSTDGGNTWTKVTNHPSYSWLNGPNDNPQNYNWITLEVTADDPDILYVYLDKITWGDEVWKVMNPLANPNWTATITGTHAQYSGGNGFGISQTNSDIVHVCNGDRYSSFLNSSQVNYGNSGNAIQYHVDVEDFASHPAIPGYLLMANHGGVHLSLDDGVTWQWFGKGLGVADVYRMSTSYSEPGYIALGLYHSGNVLSDGNYYPSWAPSWIQLGGLDGQRPLIDPKTGSILYWNSQGNWGAKRSEDYGVTTSAIGPGNNPGWDVDWNLDQEQPNFLFATAKISSVGEVKRSSDRGDSWETISDFAGLLSGSLGNIGNGVWRIYKPQRNSEHLVAHMISSREDVDGNRLPDVQKLIRTSNSRLPAASVISSWEILPLPTVQRTDQNGQTVMVEKNGSPWIADVGFDPQDPNIIFIAYSSQLSPSSSPTGSEMLYRMNYNLNPGDPGFQTDLTGSTNNALPNTGAGWDSFVVEKRSNGGMYFHTDAGVFYTNNELMASGDEWVTIGTGLPHASSHGIEINYESNKLRVALPGRGVWESNLYCPSLTSATESGTQSNDKFLEVQQHIDSDAIIETTTDVTYRGGTEITLLPGFHAEHGAEFAAFIHRCDGPGNSFKSGSDENLINRWSTTNESSRVDLLVYPNPTRGQFSVVVGEGTCILGIDAIDVTGRRAHVQVQSDELCSKKSYRLGHSTNSSGLYTLRVTLSDKSVVTSRIILR